MRRLWRLLGVLFWLAFLMNMAIELVSRRSVVSLADYMAARPLVFLVNTLLVLTLFLPALFVRRKWFALAASGVVWAVAGVTNGVLLLFRTTPFTATDLKLIKYGATLLTTYLTWWQIGAGSGSCFALYFYMEKSSCGSRAGEPYPVGLCGLCGAGSYMGNLESCHIKRTGGSSFREYRAGVYRLWLSLLLCQFCI